MEWWSAVSRDRHLLGGVQHWHSPQGVGSPPPKKQSCLCKTINEKVLCSNLCSVLCVEKAVPDAGKGNSQSVSVCH